MLLVVRWWWWAAVVTTAVLDYYPMRRVSGGQVKRAQEQIEANRVRAGRVTNLVVCVTWCLAHNTGAPSYLHVQLV